MVKIGRQRKAKRYDYDRNRRKLNKKMKRKAVIEDKTLKNAWVDHKSINYNLESMGLCADPNRAVSSGKSTGPSVKHNEQLPDKKTVCNELERQAAIPEAFRMKMSEPDTQYVVYMLDKYEDDYKAMARDKRNYYQDTPKQIRKKIMAFKKIPGMYETFLLLKNQGQSLDSLTATKTSQ